MKNLFFSVLVFTVVFVLFASLEAQTSCTFDESILNSDAEHYFAFKGLGRIQEASATDPDFASLVTAELVGISGKDLDYGNQYSFFYEYNASDERGVALAVLGDPDMETLFFTTFVLAGIPVTYLELMQEQNIDRLPLAPFVEIKDLTLSKDSDYAKYCTIASNKKTVSEEFGEVGVGQFQVCFNNNTDFSAGENFKLTMMAELVVGEEMLENYEDAETFDDLCECVDSHSGEEVDCSGIEWEEGGDDDDSGAEHYFKFKGKGIINQENEKHPTYISGSTSELAGVEGKKLSSPSPFFAEYTLSNADPDLENWVSLDVSGDIDSSGYPSTRVFVLIPVYYINLMIEEEVDMLPFAPFTWVFDYRFSKNHAFVKECTVAMNKNGFNEYGEAGIGEFQVDLTNNIDFSAGETFDLAMNAELVVGQELINSYEDVETDEDLCRCYKINGGDVDCSEIDWEGTGKNDDDSGSDDTGSDASDEDTVNTDDETDSDVEDDGKDDTENSDVPTDGDDTSTGKEKGKSGCSVLYI